MTGAVALSAEDRRRLAEVLAERQRWGMLGGDTVNGHIDHALGFVPRLRALRPSSARTTIADLGSGAGVPGLVLAVALPETAWVLIERREKRADALVLAARALAIEERVTVLAGSAERVAHDSRYRSACEAVVARSFGSPAAAAEASAGLLVLGGRLLVSEPPGLDPERWPVGPLVSLGFGRPTWYDGVVELVLERLPEPSVPRRRLQPPLF